MKILICNRHPQFSLGGSEIQCDLIARHLHHQGHQVVYAALGADEAITDEDYPVVTVEDVHLRSLHRLLRQIEPDLLYWRYNRNTFLRAALLCHFTGTKSVFSVSNPKDLERWLCFTEQARPLLSAQGATTFAKRRAQQLIGGASYQGFRFFDGVVSLSMNLLERVPPLPAGPTHREAIYNSMKDDEVEPFRWPRPYVAWVANLKRCKNPEHVVTLARQLRDLPVDFLMCGDIQHREYEYLNDPSQLPENLFYLGPKTVAEVNGILSGALCMVHTCDPEGFGNNFIQAWLQRTPTVSLHFDPDELIETQRLGFLSRTPTRFQRHVRQLFGDPRLRQQMGGRARDFAVRHFHPDRNLPRYEAFFESVIAA